MMGFVFYVILIIIVISATSIVMHNPPPPIDKDGDGIPDTKDNCIDVPEIFNGFEDSDGCPDPTPPTSVKVTGTPDRKANQNEWYNSPVTITWTGRDNFGNLINNCSKPVTYSGPDGAGISVTGNCIDNIGRPWPGNFVLNYDSTPPPIDKDQDGIPDPSDNCPAIKNSDQKDTDNDGKGDTCDNDDDNDSIIDSSDLCPTQKEIMNGFEDSDGCPDPTPPTSVKVTGTPDRKANQNEWYNSPVTITWTGRDNFGNLINNCSKPVTYSGPDGAGISVTGNCIDNIGRPWPGNFVLNYDSTPPTIPSLTATDSFNNKLNDGVATPSGIVNFYFSSTDNFGQVEYKCSLDHTVFQDCTSPKLITNSVEAIHNFEVISYDRAGNTYEKSASFSWNFYIIG